METLKPYSNYLLPAYSNLPTGRYVHLVLVRETETEAIFRTEGSDEPLNRELVSAGMKDRTPIQRIIISKRKQTAVERRTGREMLRGYGLLQLEGKECMLNTNDPCERCVDCWLYGYAAGGGGAQKSRVMTEEAFSILPAGLITDTKTFNALFDNSTMRHPVTNEPSTSINSSEYVRPQSHFVDIETLKDVTAAELAYVLLCVFNSRRYGAISSRIGRVKNHLLALIFSRTEIFSTLELVQKAYDYLAERLPEIEHPLDTILVKEATLQAAEDLLKGIMGPKEVLKGEGLQNLIAELDQVFRDPAPFLKELTRSYPKNQALKL